jgi:hypothetical protein
VSESGSGLPNPQPSRQQMAVLRHYVACGLDAARTERRYKHSERNVRRLATRFPGVVDRLEIAHEAERRQDEREAQERARSLQRDIDAFVAAAMPRAFEIVERLLNSAHPADQLRGIRLICELRSKPIALRPEPDAFTRQQIRRLQEEA